MIATRVTDTHYLQQNHGMILSSSENSFPKRTSVFRMEWSFVLQFAGTWQRNCGKAAETMWQLRGHALGSVTWSGKVLGVERWRFAVVAGRSDVGTSFLSFPLASWKLKACLTGAAFATPPLLTSQPLWSWKEARGWWEFFFPEWTLRMKEAATGCERHWTVFLGTY